MRTKAYRIILFFLLVFLFLGLFFLQVLRGNNFFQLSLKNSIRLIPAEAYRGRIFDRNNNIMVDNILSFDAVVIPQELRNREEEFERLSKVLSLDKREISKKYERNYLNPFTPVAVACGISKIEAIMLEEQGLDLGGVTVELNSKRFYVHGSTASHILGYVGEIDKSRITRLKDYGYDIKDKIGYTGVEEALDVHLRGDKGGQQIEVDNRGRQVRLLGYKPPRFGKDVQLTVDLELQQISDRLLQGRRGAVVLMDVDTGEIIIMSSSPAFDPNIFIDRRDKKSLNYFLTSDEAPLFNRAISGQFPPASIFKVITALAALKEKRLTEHTTFHCVGQHRVGNRIFKCWSTHGQQDFFQAMGNSCDVYFYQVGLLAGADNITQTAKAFGLSEPTGIDLPNEAAGFIPSRMWRRLSRFQGWYDGDTANFAIGQGETLVTPLQLARLMAAVANGGYLIEPHLVKSIDNKDIEYHMPRNIKIPKEDLDLVRESLWFPVFLKSGTAHVLNIKGLEICAKTGTAQVFGKKPHAIVAGFFPRSSPKYSFCVFLEHGVSGYYACLLARDLFQEMVKRKKVGYDV